MIQQRSFMLARACLTRNFSVKFDGSNPFEKEPLKKNIQDDIDELKWRTPMGEKSDEWYSKFKLFATENDTNSQVLTAMQQPFDFSITGIKKRRKNKAVKTEIFMQQFIPERHEILGNDLAAAHFVVHRGGSVRFAGVKNWTKRDDNDEYQLPTKFDKKFLVEAIKCDNMELYYEGLENLRRLKNLKFLSFHNVTTFDDWCLDRVSGSEFNSLEILDLSKTNITERGLGALYRIPSLKLLILDDPIKDKSFELTCAMLEEIIPNLKIVEATSIHNKE